MEGAFSTAWPTNRHPFLAKAGTTISLNDKCEREDCAKGLNDQAHQGLKPIFQPNKPYTITLPDTALRHTEAESREVAKDADALVVWNAYSDAVLALLRTKQAYGSAWRDQGYMGNLARIQSKTSRLKNMLWGDYYATKENPTAEGHSETESVQDTLMDLMALCAFMAANLEDGNRWGS